MILNRVELALEEKREKLIDWIMQMDEIGLDELIEEYL